jgi:hypothetical protein
MRGRGNKDKHEAFHGYAVCISLILESTLQSYPWYIAVLVGEIHQQFKLHQIKWYYCVGRRKCEIAICHLWTWMDGLVVHSLFLIRTGHIPTSWNFPLSRRYKFHLWKCLAYTNVFFLKVLSAWWEKRIRLHQFVWRQIMTVFRMIYKSMTNGDHDSPSW